ncbi:MAG: alpha/beta hydrolase [Ginsengibacter sp.]
MKQVAFQNKKIWYRTEGSGKPVILLHGFAEDSNIWNYQLQTLSKKCYVIVPDLPGSGKSALQDGATSIEDYAELVKAIVDVEIINNNKDTGVQKLFTLIGHSMGGYITLAFAEKYPELLSGFGLFHSTAYADNEAKKETRRKGIEFIKNNGAYEFIKTTTPNLFSEKTKNEDPCLVEKLIDQYKGFSSGSLIQYYEAMIQRPDRTSVLKSFQKPVLFIIGKHDTAIPLQASLEQCHLPAVSYIHILQNSGHMGMWEEKEPATKFLLDFLMPQ